METLVPFLLLFFLCAGCALLGYWLGHRAGNSSAPGEVREKFHVRLFDGGFNAYVTFEQDVEEGDMLGFIDAIRPFVEQCEQERAAKRQGPST